MNRYELKGLIKGVFKRKEQGAVFAITIDGDIYIGNKPEELDTKNDSKPIITFVKECDTIEDFYKKIKEMVGGCAEYIDQYKDLSDPIIKKRYNTCLEIYEIIGELYV